MVKCRTLFALIKKDFITNALMNNRICCMSTDTSRITRKLTIAIIGAPNSGKSTLVNCMVNAKVSAVSEVAHTTRTFTNGILNIGDTQLIFTDTPGAISYQEGRRLKMDKYQVRTPSQVASSADLLAVITDCADRKSKQHIDENVLKILSENTSLPTVLIMNKVDLLKHKEELLHLTTLLTQDRGRDEWGYKRYGGSSRFKDIFYISALENDGVNELLEYFVQVAKDGEWEYSSNIYCDSSIDKLISEVFQEKLLKTFKQEIPWQCKHETVYFEDHETHLRIHHKLTWPRKSQQRYVRTRIDQIAEEATHDLENMFQCKVVLTVMVSQKKNMTKDDLITF